MVKILTFNTQHFSITLQSVINHNQKDETVKTQ